MRRPLWVGALLAVLAGVAASSAAQPRAQAVAQAAIQRVDLPAAAASAAPMGQPSSAASASASASPKSTVRAGTQEFEPLHVPMTVRQVSPHGYYVLGQAGAVSQENEGFNSNAGFVVTGDGVVVFDTLGTPALGHRLRELIAQTTHQPIRLVILSHYHADHFYGAQAFAGPGVDIWAHGLVRDYLASPAPTARLAERRESLAPWVNEHTRVVVPTRYLGEDTSLTMGGLHLRISMSVRRTRRKT